jgi:hypothetical protein
MSTLTLDTKSTGRDDRSRPAYKVTGVRVLRSEWSKLWTLRSTWITLGLSLVLLVAFAAISAATYKSGGHGMGADAKDAVAVALGGLDFAQLAIGVLGVLGYGDQRQDLCGGDGHARQSAECYERWSIGWQRIPAPTPRPSCGFGTPTEPTAGCT